MDIELPEIAIITLKGLVSLTILLGLVDTALAIIFALLQHKFDASYTAEFLISHGKLWFCIIALGVFGNGIPALDIPPLRACWIAAIAGLVAYAVVVIASLAANARDSRAPAGGGDAGGDDK